MKKYYNQLNDGSWETKIDRDLSFAIELLSNEEVVAIPTETVYGLAADATNESALRQIYAIKQRPANNPLIVHIGDIAQVSNWAATFLPLAQKLANAFWPGPFTLVLPAKEGVSTILRADGWEYARQLSAHPLLKWWIRLLLQATLK